MPSVTTTPITVRCGPDARSRRTTYGYDKLDRETSRVYGTQRATLAYDPVSNLTSLADWTGTITKTYNELDRVHGVLNPDGGRLTFAWDALGQRDFRIDIQGGRTTFTHNEGQRITALVNGPGRVTVNHQDRRKETISENLKKSSKSLGRIGSKVPCSCGTAERSQIAN